MCVCVHARVCACVCVHMFGYVFDRIKFCLLLKFFLTLSVQPHYLKTDFNKWKDEDDSGSDLDDDIYGGGGDLNAVGSLHFIHSINRDSLCC